MAPDRSNIPIPTYDEAVAVGSAWRATDREMDDEEGRLLLADGEGSRRRRIRSGRPGDYTSPTAETDDEEDGSDEDGPVMDVDSDFDGRESVADEANLVRREMQEFEVEESGRSRGAVGGVPWRKRIPFALPTWKWTWRGLRLPRMPRMQIRLPSGSTSTSTSTSSSSPQPTSTSADTSTSTAPHSTIPLLPAPSFPRPSTQVFLLFARILAMGLIASFFYLLFSGSLRSLGGNTGRIQPAPEALRHFVLDSVDPRRLRLSVQHFTRYAHVAGTEGDYAVALDIETMFRRAGLQDVTVEEYCVYANYPQRSGRAIEVIGPDDEVTWTAKLEEEDVGGETAGTQTWAFHAHSREGSAEGPLIYVNFGSLADFNDLVKMDIQTKGAIALVRHGQPGENVGMKVKLAEVAGFVGCIIFADDSSSIGGPHDELAVPEDAVHRSSVSLPNWVIGDPLTPGWESKKGLPIMEPEKSKGLVGIPSLPLSWRDARELLTYIEGQGQPVPARWAGAGVRWIGDQSSPLVRIRNEQDEDPQKRIWNVRGRLGGYDQGEKAVIVGNAHDSLAFGATDPHGGTAVMVELARLFGRLYEGGWRPLRTIEFASWDASALNAVGATEFVEHNAKALREDAFAYLNLADVVTPGGKHLRAQGSPLFRNVLGRVLRHVHNSDLNATLDELWGQAYVRGIEPPSFGGPGGAGRLDSVPFLTIAGTPTLDFRFDRPPQEGPRGNVAETYPWGSNHDNFEFVERAGDPGWVYHALAAQVAGLVLVELVDQHVLGLSAEAYGEELVRAVGSLDSWLRARDSDAETRRGIDAMLRGVVTLMAAAKEVQAQGARLGAWVNEWQKRMMSTGWIEDGPVRNARWMHNEIVGRLESKFLDLESLQQGPLPERPQFRHVVYGPRAWDIDDGGQFPGIRDSVEVGDWVQAEKLTVRAVSVMHGAIEWLKMFDGNIEAQA